MADAPIVHIGENSPEKIAFDLMQKIINKEAKTTTLDRKWYLDTYAECLSVVRNPEGRLYSAKAKGPGTAGYHLDLEE